MATSTVNHCHLKTMQQSGSLRAHCAHSPPDMILTRMKPMLSNRRLILSTPRHSESRLPASEAYGSTSSSETSSIPAAAAKDTPTKLPPSLHRILPLATASPFLSPTSSGFDFPHTTSYTTERGDTISDVELIQLLSPYVADVRMER